MDFSGFEVWADSAVAMARPVFKCAAAGSVLRVGENAPADVTLIDPLFDGTGMSAAMAAAFQVLRGASLTVKGGRFDNAQRLHFKSWGEALVLDNGSGLSRSERISPLQMAQLVRAALHSRHAPDFWMSLPAVGVDGTQRNRLKDSPATGVARMRSPMRSITSGRAAR